VVRDLHLLPRVEDGLSYLYVEHARIDKSNESIAIEDPSGAVPVPCAALCALLLGPGTTITHAAMRILAECGCSVLWVGEQGVRTYAQGMGETRSAKNLLRQARLWADPISHLEVVLRMYRLRFAESLEPGLTLEQIRGKEGVRVRESYAKASRETGVEWSGRNYRRDTWDAADPVNRALSCANSCLYGVCHAAIVSSGYSPALGFVHTGKILAFVYDVADLYKTAIATPAAFAAVASGVLDLEGRVRRACRDAIVRERLLARIVADIDTALGAKAAVGDSGGVESVLDDDVPGGLWDPRIGEVPGGTNQADQKQA